MSFWEKFEVYVFNQIKIQGLVFLSQNEYFAIELFVNNQKHKIDISVNHLFGLS